MASTKDILDGQRFNRQRLVTAFTSGMPGGRELTPVRPWRGILTSFVLTAILVVGAWISKLFLPTLPNGWDNGKLVVNSDNGSRYVSISGTLYPVRNSSSAHLLFPDASTVSAGDDALAKVELGPVVGIEGAPDKVPDASKIENATLMSCIANDGLLWTGVNKGESKSAGSAGALVSNGESSYLIVGEYRYAFNQTNYSTNQKASARSVMNELGFSNPSAAEVPSEWVLLFKEGEALVPLEVPEAGTSAGEVPGVGEAKVGTLLEVSDSINKGAIYLVLKDGYIQPMSKTMRHMYAMSSSGSKAATKSVTSHDIANAKLVTDEQRLRPTWPQEITGLVDAPDKPCARVATGGETTLVRGVNVPKVSSTQNKVSVASQSGALLTQPGDNANLHYLIDEDGHAYKLDDFNETSKAFGYSNVTPIKASSSWLKLFPSSNPNATTPTLSSEAAWETVPKDARQDGKQSGGGSNSNTGGSSGNSNGSSAGSGNSTGRSSEGKKR